MLKTSGRLGLSLMCLLILLLTACGTRYQNETVIISGDEMSEQANQELLSPVQVQKIYRLPDENTDNGYWLGWTSSDSLIGSFKNTGFPERYKLKELAYPFEESKNIIQSEGDHSRIALSPDGDQIADVHTHQTTITTTLMSTKDGKKTEVDTFDPKGQSYLQTMSWSENSQMIGYLVLDAAQYEKNTLRVYDTKTKSSQSYSLQGFNPGDSLLDAQVSKDGRSALIKLFETGQWERTTIVFGKLADGHFEPKYRRQMADNHMTWISEDQFAFLGSDDTLYEYDQRNGELSVILERVFTFEFSPDKKFIAYTLQDEDAVYVGKIQGRNVLYNGPVYRGILASNMKWSSDNTRLFIQGSRTFTNSKSIANDNSTKEHAFIIEFE